MVAASLTMLFACEKPVDLGPEEVTIVSSDVPEEIPMDGGEYTIELKATLDWSVQNYEGDVTSWLNITPSRGSASADNQTVSIKVLPNEGANRSFKIDFYGNIMHSASLTITQPGPDGDGESITVAKFLELKDTENEYVLTGKIGDLPNPNTSFKGFSISDGTGIITCAFPKNIAEYELGTGDEVSIRGKYELYEDEGKEPEDQLYGGTILSHTPASRDNIETVTISQFIENADMFQLYRLVGEVSGIKNNAPYYSFNLSDDSGESVQVYSVNNADEYRNILKNGDTVTLIGAYLLYGTSTHEVVDATIEKVEAGQGGEDPDDPTEEPTSATPITIAEFLQKPVNNTDWYELTGEIVSIVSGNAYGNFTIKDDTGSVYIYGMVQAWAGGKNDQSFNKIGLKVGDTVTLWSLRDEHDGQPQGGGSDIPAIYKSHEEGATVTYPEGTVFLTFPDGNQKSVSSYTDTWTAICGGYTFTIANFNNNRNGWSYIKCGREKAASVASIANATAMPELSSIEVSVDNVTMASSVNSVTLTIYSDEANSVQVGEPIAWTDYSAGVWEFTIPEGVQADDLYYKLTFDCAPHGSSNGIIQISKVTYIAAE